MYGNNQAQAQYGWSSGPVVRTNEVVELPMRPVRQQRSAECCYCGPRGMNWLWFGIILSLLAAASLALGVADVVRTYQRYMVDFKCKDMEMSATPCYKNNLVWTWVAVGIWASLPIFILGILAIRIGKRPGPMGSSWFELFAFLSAFIFAPAMIALSVIEVVKGHNVYYWSYDDSSFLDEDDLAKAIIPIVIAGLGAVEFLMAFIAVWYQCCCRQDVYGGEQVITYQRSAPAPTYVQAPQAPCGPAQCGQVNYGPSRPLPPVNSCAPCGGGNGVYYKPAQTTTTGFGPRPTTYNYFANSRPASYQAYNQYR